MAACIVDCVDVEENVNNLHAIFLQVISVHLYCWLMLLSIVSVSSLSIVKKSNVIAKTITNTLRVWVQQHFDNQYVQIIDVFFIKLYISAIF